MCGDPPNIIIGTSLGYTFGEFISNTGFIALISLIVIVIYFYLCFHKELAGQGAAVQITSYPDPKEAITDKGEFAKSCVIFLLAVVLLVTHAQTGLTVAFIGMFIAILTLVTQYKDAKELLSKVDYKTLLFFIGLFVVVGGLEQTGVLEEIAGLISKLSGSNGMLMCAIILWISAIASAFVDNIPFAATMIPVIQTLSALQGHRFDYAGVDTFHGNRYRRAAQHRLAHLQTLLEFPSRPSKAIRLDGDITVNMRHLRRSLSFRFRWFAFS